MILSSVTDVLVESLWGVAAQVIEFAIAVLIFLAVLALIKISLRKLISYIKNKLSRS